MESFENNVKRNILREAGNIVDGARRKAYGTPEDNFARIADFWNTYLRCTGREAFLTSADVSPMMRLMKEARLCESPDHRDSFVDIIGYALTGAEINLPEEPDHWADDIADTPEEKSVLDGLTGGKRPEEKRRSFATRTYETVGEPCFGLYPLEWEMLEYIETSPEVRRNLTCPVGATAAVPMCDFLSDIGYIDYDDLSGWLITEGGRNMLHMKRSYETSNEDSSMGFKAQVRNALKMADGSDPTSQ